MKAKITLKLLAATGGLAFFELNFLPSLNLLAWVFIAMVLDLITGVAKAIALRDARTSTGYRKTITKFFQYVVAILVGVILGNTLPKDNVIVGYVNDGLLILLIYIEATSIFENLYAINSTSQFSRYFISPILKLLTLAIRKSPLAQTDPDENK